VKTEQLFGESAKTRWLHARLGKQLFVSTPGWPGAAGFVTRTIVQPPGWLPPSSGWLLRQIFDTKK
jgi:hypothetical protein